MTRAMTRGPVEFTSPRWAGDFVGHDSILPVPGKLDPDEFAPMAAVEVVVGAAGADIGDTTVPVDALSGPIPNNTRLRFPGGDVVLTAEAEATDVALTVEPLVFALVDNDAADFAGTDLSSVPSGTAVGRTIAERDAGDPWGPADAADDELYLIVFDCLDVDDNADCEFYRPGKVVKENYLPAFATLDPDVVAAIRARYVCITGKE